MEEVLHFDRWHLFEEGELFLLEGPPVLSWADLMGLSAEILLVKEWQESAPFRNAREALLPEDLRDPRRWIAQYGKVLTNRQIDFIEKQEEKARGQGVVPPGVRDFSPGAFPAAGIRETSEDAFELCDEAGVPAVRFSAGQLTLMALFVVSDGRSKEYLDQYAWHVAEHLPSMNPEIDALERDARVVLRKAIDLIRAV